MDANDNFNLIAFDLERLYRTRPEGYVAVRIHAPFFPSPIMGTNQQEMINRMARRGLVLCRVPRSSDALVYDISSNPQGKTIALDYTIPHGVHF